MPAELVDLYIQLDGSAAAFEQRAELPKGTVTGSHSAALKVQEDSSEQRTDASEPYPSSLATVSTSWQYWLSL